MRFIEFSLFFALSAATIVFGQKPGLRKLTSQSLTVPATSDDKTTYTASTSRNHLMARQGSAGGSNFCSGVGATCATCFGPGYVQCPDGIYCYNPSVPGSDCTTSSGSGSGLGYDLGSGFDICYDHPTCASCFGSGYIKCPGVSDTCYNPNDPTSVCSYSSGSGSGSVSGSGSGSGLGSGSESTATTPYGTAPTSGSELGSGSSGILGPSSDKTTTTSAAPIHTSSTPSSGSSSRSEPTGNSGSSGNFVPASNARALDVSLGLSYFFSFFAMVAI